MHGQNDDAALPRRLLTHSVPGKDIIDTSAEDNGDIEKGSADDLDACCNSCRNLAILGHDRKAVVWNTGKDCYFKSINGPLVEPKQGTAYKGDKVTAAFP
jgi:hypothetical protein